MDTKQLSDEFKDMLTEVFHIGVGKAAAALSDMLDELIEMEVPQLYFFNQESLESFSQKLKGKYICVFQKLEGDLEGVGSLSFPLVEGKTLVDQLLNRTSPKPDFGAIEMEAIEEVGNVIINAVGSAFNNIFGLRVEYDVPQIAFVDTPIPLNFSNKNDEVFYTFANTSLKAKQINIDGYLNMTFAYSNFEMLERILRTYSGFSKKFGELLVEAKYVNSTQLDEALNIQGNSRKFIGELLVEHGYITSEQRDHILQSEKYKRESKKFGEAVIEEYTITPEQLEQVIDAQRLSRSLLGEVLIALGHLNEKTRDQAIETQRVAK